MVIRLILYCVTNPLSDKKRETLGRKYKFLFRRLISTENIFRL